MSVAAQIVLTLALLTVVVAFVLYITTRIVSLPVALIFWGGALAVFLVYAFAKPLHLDRLGSNPNPAENFAEAKTRFDALSAAEGPEINPVCRSFLLDHGARTARTAVLFHGLSNCPQSMVELAPLLHERGYNVLVTRMPENGLADRATPSLAKLTGERIRDYAQEGVDIARGLGEEVVALGISGGGTAAAWAAQMRDDVDRVVLTAPFMGLSTLGPRLNWVLMKLALALPPISVWRDPIARADFTGGLPYSMLRQSTRGTGEMLRTSWLVQNGARNGPPAADKVVMMLNPNDTSVSNRVSQSIYDDWARHDGDVALKWFPADPILPHEIIDPNEPTAHTDIVYPLLIEAIEGSEGAGS